MRKLIALLVLFAGCSPQPGGIYENMLTQERIQIERVGDCLAIKADYEAENELATSAIDGTFTNEQGIKLSLTTIPVLEEGVTGKCFAYEQRKEIEGGPWVIDGRETRVVDMNFAYILPLSALGEWEKVN